MRWKIALLLAVAAAACSKAERREPPPASCPAGLLGARLGLEHLAIGGSMEDAAFAAAPFDLRYQYVAGGVPAGGPCADCTACVVDGQSCANDAGGCGWWGCWQWDQEPPGRFVARFVEDTAAAGALPMISLYEWFTVAGNVEGAPELAALQDGGRVSSYLADVRFLCETMAEPDVPALLHLEPDLWGYGHHASADPAAIPVALSAAAAPECAALPDTLAGFARCLAAVCRAAAPRVLLGYHASAWGAGHDALVNADPGFDLLAHADATAAFMAALGAEDADLVVVEMSDRDAGFNGRWWDETDATLPSFAQAITWAGRVGERLELPLLWWQVPYGHEGLDDTCGRYRDNRVDYVLDHPDRFAAGGALGVAFGAGAGCMTAPATDGGHFVSRAADHLAGARPRLCGP